MAEQISQRLLAVLVRRGQGSSMTPPPGSAAEQARRDARLIQPIGEIASPCLDPTLNVAQTGTGDSNP